MTTMMHTTMALSVTAVMMSGAAIWHTAETAKDASVALAMTAEQHVVVAPMVEMWWVEHCFGMMPGAIDRDDYDACIDIYEWLSDYGIGPFKEVE